MKFKRGDCVKIKNEDQVYIIKDVGGYSVLLDWIERSIDQTWKKIEISEIELINNIL